MGHIINNEVWTNIVELWSGSTGGDAEPKLHFIVQVKVNVSAWVEECVFGFGFDQCVRVSCDGRRQINKGLTFILSALSAQANNDIAPVLLPSGHSIAGHNVFADFVEVQALVNKRTNILRLQVCRQGVNPCLALITELITQLQLAQIRTVNCNVVEGDRCTACGRHLRGCGREYCGEGFLGAVGIGTADLQGCFPTKDREVTASIKATRQSRGFVLGFA